ncbi:hypothetical protein BX666DRAFT_2154550 [Dichotomocladium elegans]|nr:hypothetical protein BX666DRAFT_2154550 [Dichotomocladium elegans]
MIKQDVFATHSSSSSPFFHQLSPMPWKALKTVYVSHSFEAKESDEITINKGEIVQVIEKDDVYKDGWWRGRNARGEIGLFPVNYTSSTAPGTATLDHKIRSLEHTISELRDVHCQRSPSFSQRPALVSDHEQHHPTIPRTTTLNRKRDILPALQTTPPDKWTVDQVAIWTKTIGLESVAQTFRDQEITGDILLELTPELLKELGITTFGKRFKIHTAIKTLKENLSAELQDPAENSSSDHAVSPMDGRKLVQSSSIGSTCLSSRYKQLDLEDSRTSDHPRSNRNYHTASSTGPPISPTAPKPQTHNTQRIYEAFAAHGSSTNADIRQTGIGSTLSNRLKNTKAAGKQWTFRQATPDIQISHSNPPVQDMPLSRSKSCPLSSNHLRLFFSSAKNSTTAEKHNIDHGVDARKIDMEGWLHKRGDKCKLWSKRWFVLSGSDLFCFRNPGDSVVKATICLRNHRILLDEHICTGKYCFKLQDTHGRTFYFYTTSEQSLKDWVRALLKASIVRDDKTPVLTSSQLRTVTLDVAQRMKPRPPSIIMQPKQTGYQSSISSTLDNRPLSLMYDQKDTRVRISKSEISMNHARAQQNTTGQHQYQEKNLSRSKSVGGSLRSLKHRVPGEKMVKREPSPHPCDPQWSEQLSTHSTKWGPIDYIDWVNQYLTRPIDRLDKMRCGEPLVELLERISEKSVQRPKDHRPESPSMHMLDIIVAAFQFMAREGIKLNGRFTIKEVFNGNEENIMRMLDAIRDRWEL